jgi:hypothetical protein
MRKRTLQLVLLISFLGVALSCGDSDDTVDSNWSGSYNMSQELGGVSGTLSFVVTGSDTVFCFTFSGQAAPYSTSCGNSATGGFPVNGLQFSIPLTTAQGSFTLQGQFASSTQASGEVVGPGSSMSTVLTWTAAETSKGSAQ